MEVALRRGDRQKYPLSGDAEFPKRKGDSRCARPGLLFSRTCCPPAHLARTSPDLDSLGFGWVQLLGGPLERPDLAQGATCTCVGESTCLSFCTSPPPLPPSQQLPLMPGSRITQQLRGLWTEITWVARIPALPFTSCLIMDNVLLSCATVLLSVKRWS